MRKAIWGVAGACALLAATPVLAVGDEALVAAARAVLEKHKAALVTVRQTVKTRMVYQGKEQTARESTSEISGTVITPAGLTVVSDSSGDPSGPSRGGSASIETDVTDVKLVFQDGREIPARFVLRDRDLDLAFVMPEEPAANLSFIAFDADVSEKPLDDVIYLSLLGKAHNREVAVALGKVHAVLTKPRTLLAVDLVDGLRSLGCPAFSATGQVLGLVVLKPSTDQTSSPEGLRDMLDMLQPVLVLAETVKELAAQAEAKRPKP
jgi:hypothetical protein